MPEAGVITSSNGEHPSVGGTPMRCVPLLLRARSGVAAYALGRPPTAPGQLPFVIRGGVLYKPWRGPQVWRTRGEETMVRPWGFVAFVTVGVLCGCQPPPPVGQAANPRPREVARARDSSSAELLEKLDAMKAQLDTRPKDFNLRMALGKLYYENERYMDAAKMFREALDERPDDPEALGLLGNSMFYLGNPDMSVNLHERVLANHPNNLASLFLLGAILVEARPQDKAALARAVECWEKFLQLNPKDPRARDVAQQLEVVKKAQRGEITLGRPEPPTQPSVDALPEDGQQGAMGGRTSFQDDSPAGGGGGAAGPRFNKGTRVPKLAADASPKERKRAEALDALDEGRFVDARKAAEDALLLAPDDPELGVARARSMVMTGEVELAIRAFGELLKKNPQYPQAWHYLGMAHMLNRDPARAAQTWRDLITMDPAYAKAHRLDARAAMAENMARTQQ